MTEFDLAVGELRDLNARLHSLSPRTNDTAWRVLNPAGRHAVAVGLDAPISVEVAGHVGFYCGGMNKQAQIVIDGHAGPGVGENMMSGTIRVRGNAAQSAGASGRGGLLVVEGDASARCGISMKGIDIVVQGSVGHMSAFMAQTGNLVVCGDAGHDLGDSIYEARVFVRGAVDSLGADCVEKDMRPEHLELLQELLTRAGVDADPRAFRRYGSARRLYHFNVDHAASY
jgi:glutamate synthase domain-containing protein 3